MKTSTRIFLALLIAGIAYGYLKLTKPLPAPDLDYNQYWGQGDEAHYKEDTSIKAQEIFYEDETINTLRVRLNDSIKFHAPLEGIDHQYGINANKMVSFIKYWRDDYMKRWPERQAFLNSLPHFLTEIQGLRIHFIHVKPNNPEGKRVVPLLLLHGWPGSVREFYEFIPMLTNPNKNSPVAFEVIAPSLPGYGWSEGSAKVGFGPAQMAVVVRNLMLRIGHKKFAIQGGDWGSIIGSNIATIFPQNVIAYHSNFCVVRSPLAMLKLVIASFWPTAFIDEKFVPMIFPLGEKFQTMIEETGYFHIQATKPDTIGAALTHSPFGLAAYILEKFVTFYPNYNEDALIDNIMIYYLTNSMTTAVRLYAEALTKNQTALGLMQVPTAVPTACARFWNDISHSIDWQLKDKYTKLMQSTYYEKGGHFAAMEEPQILLQDLIMFMNLLYKK